MKLFVLNEAGAVSVLVSFSLRYPKPKTSHMMKTLKSYGSSLLPLTHVLRAALIQMLTLFSTQQTDVCKKSETKANAPIWISHHDWYSVYRILT